MALLIAETLRAESDLPTPVLAFREVVKSRDRETFSTAALALRRWMIDNDRHRPVYHFTGPESWINDPNGPIYFKGQYHLFYQYDPIVPDAQGGWRRVTRCWGHAVSDDLVHWSDWPVAIWPDTPYNPQFVASGNTFVGDDGAMHAMYTGCVQGHAETYGMLARSSDDGLTWTKKMVMPNSDRPNPKSPVHWDGQVWKEGDTRCD